MADPNSHPGSRGNFTSTVAQRGILVPLALLALAACDTSETIVTPAQGAIEVTTLTEGVGQLPDSFNILLNGSRSGTVGPNDTYLMTLLPRGDYVVALLEESENCRFTTNPRLVTVGQNDTTVTTFLVRCK
jgi:hypothetical protein